MCRYSSYNAYAFIWVVSSILTTALCILGFYFPTWLQVYNPLFQNGLSERIIFSPYRICQYPTSQPVSPGNTAEIPTANLTHALNECVSTNTTTLALYTSYCPPDPEKEVQSEMICMYNITPNTPYVDFYCDSYLEFDSILTVEWKAATLLMSVGVCSLVVVSLLALFGCCIPNLFNLWLTFTVGAIQIIGALCFTSAVLIFPLGLRSEVMNAFCSFEKCKAGAFSLGICTFGWAYYLTIIGTVMALLNTALVLSTGCKRKDKETSYNI